MDQETEKQSTVGGFTFGVSLSFLACVVTGAAVSQCSTRPVSYTEGPPTTKPAFEFIKNDALELSLSAYSWSGDSGTFQIRDEALKDVRYAQIACRLTMADKTVQSVAQPVERRKGDIGLETLNTGILSGEPQTVVCHVDDVQ